MLAVLLQIDAWDPEAAAPVVLQAASHDDSALCVLNGGTWWPAIAKLPTLRYDLFDGDFSAQISAPSSSLTLQSEPWADFGRYALADGRIRLWTGELGEDWDGFTLRFDGRVSSQPALADGQAPIDFAVDDRWLDQSLLATYAGTTGAEGPAALKGQAKPLAIGAPRYAAGTLIDSVNSVFQVSAYGPIQGFEAGLEKLARFGAPIGDAVNYVSLIAADVPAGTWATCNAQGMARFGAPPAGQVSFLVQGDTVGGWSRKPGQVITRLATLANAAARLDAGSLAALDAARPYNLSLMLTEQGSARDLIQKVAASVNAVAGVSWTGQLFAIPVALGVPSITLAADGSMLPPVASVKQIENAAPWQKLAITAERAWTVHQLADIAFEAPLVDRGRYDPNETYREGNIVDLADGSRWLDVATDPVKGIQPGTIGDVTWYNMNPAMRAGDITYADGQSIEALKPADPGATKGAPAGTYVGDKEAFELIADLQDQVTAISNTIGRVDQLRDLINAVGYIEGQSAATYTQQEHTERVEGLKAINDFLDLFVAKSADGTAAILKNSLAISSPDGTEAQTLETLYAAATAAKVGVQQLNDAFIANDGTGYAKSLLQVFNGDTIAGLSLTAGGTVAALKFLANIFQFIDPNGGQPITPFYYADGTLYLDNVYAKKLTVEAVADTIGQSFNPADFELALPGGFTAKGGQIRAAINDETQFSVVLKKPFNNACVFRIAIGYIETFGNQRDLWLQNCGPATVNGGAFNTQAATTEHKTLDGIDYLFIGN